MSTLSTVTCGACGVDFAIPERRLEALRESGETFYCPNGHPRAYNKGQTREQLRETLEQVKRARDGYWERAYNAERLVRVKQRELRTCPLCGRYFRGRAQVSTHLVDDHGASDRPMLSIASKPLKQIGNGA